MPQTIEAAVLLKSKRRCALCAHLNNDYTEKKGQVAHLDGDSGNFSEDNLAFMCFDHHAEYDSQASQHKNYTLLEVKESRDRLYEYIAHNAYLTLAAQGPSGREADTRTLKEIQATMDKVPDYFLRHPNFGGCSLSVHEIQNFEAAVKNRHKPEHEFIDPELEELRWRFVSEGSVLFDVMMSRLKPIRTQEGYYSLPWDWQRTDPDRLDRVAKSLDEQAAKVALAYHELIRAARRKLEK